MRLDIPRRELVALGACGALVLAARSFSSAAPDVDALLEECPHVRAHPNLTRIVATLKRLDPDRTVLPRVVEATEHTLAAAAAVPSAENTPEAERMVVTVNQLSSRAMEAMTELVDRAKRDRRDTVVRDCVHFVDDEFQVFESVMESVLHNAMLDSFR